VKKAAHRKTVGQNGASARRRDPILVIPAGITTDEAILGLIDDAIVPALVEAFLRAEVLPES